MKKIYPYILPLIALLFVAFLGYRWYQSSTERTPEVSPFGEGVQIENLSQEEADKIVKGTGDYKAIKLAGLGALAGTLRYENKDGRINFSVVAALPQNGVSEDSEASDGAMMTDEKANYVVWLQKEGSEEKVRAYDLVYGKSGFFGSGSLSIDLLPFDVVITQERPDGSSKELLRGTITKENIEQVMDKMAQ